MLKVTIELPEIATLFTKDDGESAKLSFKAMQKAGVLESFLSGADGALVRALRIPAMNAYNSPGAKGTKAEKSAAVAKRVESWERGEWAIVERGEGIMTAYRDEVFLPLCLEQGMTLAKAEALIKAKVKESFPPETKATFANFIEATALERKAEFDGNVDEARSAIMAYYESALAERRKARDAAESKVTMPTIDLAAFKKAK